MLCLLDRLLREGELKPKDNENHALIGKCVPFSVWTDRA